MRWGAAAIIIGGAIFQRQWGGGLWQVGERNNLESEKCEAKLTEACKYGTSGTPAIYWNFVTKCSDPITK